MMFAPDLLKGRVALITGGAGGIGFEISKTYARLGAQVVLASRSQERLDGAVAEMAAEGLTAIAFKTDVRNYDEVEATIERTF